MCVVSYGLMCICILNFEAQPWNDASEQCTRLVLAQQLPFDLLANQTKSATDLLLLYFVLYRD